jgi:hypothetical protein
MLAGTIVTPRFDSKPLLAHGSNAAFPDVTTLAYTPVRMFVWRDR